MVSRIESVESEPQLGPFTTHISLSVGVETGVRGQRNYESSSTLRLLFTRWASAQILTVDTREKICPFSWFIVNVMKKKNHIPTSVTHWSNGCCGRPTESSLLCVQQSFVVLTTDVTFDNPRLWAACLVSMLTQSAVHRPRVRGATGEEFTKLARRRCCVIL